MDIRHASGAPLDAGAELTVVAVCGDPKKDASFKALDAKQLEDALHKAFALNAPALVWVPHGDVPSPWDLIMMPRVRG